MLSGRPSGRGGELTARFSRASRRLAELELRQRMAGRWMMAWIQATFSIMPALVYGLGGLVAPFFGIKVIDLAIVALHLT